MRAHALALAAVLLPGSALAVSSETVMIPMRDGTRLATNVFSPSDGRILPTLLIRTPYGKDFIPLAGAEQICDDMGYALIVQDTRGRGDSEGVDDVFMSDGWAENQDGWDTLDWIEAQPWSDGEVGMVGASALGIASYLAAGTYHPALKAMWVGITPSVFYDQAVYQGGAFREALVTDWLNGQGSGYMLQTYKDHPDYDDLWASLDLRNRYDEMTVPIYHWGGWYDIFAEGPLSAFSSLQSGGPDGVTGPQKLLMGPWTHIDRGAWSRVQGELTYPDNSLVPVGELNPFKWFDRFLKDEPHAIQDWDPLPVRFYVMGDVDNPDSPANRWERAPTWPVRTRSHELYLRADGSLTEAAPEDFPAPLSFVTDPEHPSQTIGGRELSLPAGPRDQAPLLERDDVLVFSTGPLDEGIKVVGDVQAQIWMASDQVDTDLAVRLIDVYPDGRNMLVTDGILRARHREGFDEEHLLTPGQIVPMYVDVGTTAILFEPGHELRIVVSSTNHRRFQINHNTAAGVWDDVDPVPVANTIFVDEAFPSRLVLPVPMKGATVPGLGGSERIASPSEIAAARRRLRAGRPLPGDRDVVGQEVGAALMETVVTHGALPGGPTSP